MWLCYCISNCCDPIEDRIDRDMRGLGRKENRTMRDVRKISKMDKLREEKLAPIIASRPTEAYALATVIASSAARKISKYQALKVYGDTITHLESVKDAIQLNRVVTQSSNIVANVHGTTDFDSINSKLQKYSGDMKDLSAIQDKTKEIFGTMQAERPQEETPEQIIERVGAMAGLAQSSKMVDTPIRNIDEPETMSTEEDELVQRLRRLNNEST